jgi:hypothetical protein
VGFVGDGGGLEADLAEGGVEALASSAPDTSVITLTDPN